MRKVQVTGCNLVQHGSEEEEIFSIDQRDLKARIACQGLLQPERRVQATESSAEYQNSLGVLHGHLTATLFSAKVRRFSLKHAYIRTTSHSIYICVIKTQ